MPNSLEAVLITRPLRAAVEFEGAGLVAEEDGDDCSASGFVPPEPEDSLSALPHPATTVAVATTRATIARMVPAKHARSFATRASGRRHRHLSRDAIASPHPSVVVNVTV